MIPHLNQARPGTDKDLQELSGAPGGCKCEVYGQEMVEKIVASSSKGGRVYLPQDWIGKRVKIILASS